MTVTRPSPMAQVSPAPGAHKRNHLLREHLLPLLVSSFFIIPIVFVFYWMISMSFQTQVEISANPPTFWSAHPTTEWYSQLMRRMPFLHYAWNSLVVGVSATGIGLAIGLPAAYAIARWRLGGLGTLFLLTRITPAISFLIPWYIIAKRLDLGDSLLIITLLHITITLPLIIWIMIGFFEALPGDLEQAATVDGCTPWQSFLLVAVPLVKPGIVAAAILAFIQSWNNFLFAAVLGGPGSQTLPVTVYGMLSFEQANWGPLAAAATLVCLPVIIGTIFFQRQLVEGLTAGALKG